VPVLGLCVNADQQLVMQGVGHAGAGIGLLARRATAESIAAASRRLLAEGGFRESARRLSARIAQSDAPQAFAKFVEEVLGAAGPAVSSAEEAGVRFQRAGANGG
jgi:UDP:flavonoid glycosyltransferase YjiC (YdhE family)